MRRIPLAMMIAFSLIIALCLPQKARAGGLPPIRQSGNKVTKTIIGNLVHADSWETTGTHAFGVVSMPSTSDNFKLSYVVKDNALNANGAGVMHDGVYQFINYMTAGSNMYCFCMEYDMATWEEKRGDLCDQSLLANAMAYDYTTKKIFGSFYNKTFSSFEFGRLDFSKKTRETISEIKGRYVAMAIDKEGKLYAISDSGNLLEVNKGTGDSTIVGNTGVLPSTNPSSAAFDYETGELYWTVTDTDNKAGLYEVDVTTGTATLIGIMEDGDQIMGLFVNDPETNPNVPSMPTSFSSVFSKGSTTGTLTFTAPSRTFGGNTLEGSLSYSITANEVVVATGNVEPGEKKTVSDITVSEGSNIFSVTVSNEAGTSNPATLIKWIGYDQPKPSSQVLFNYNNETKLADVSWKASTAGVHGGYVDKNSLTYDIVRMPDNVLVAESISALSFSETLNDEQMRSVYYQVISRNGGKSSDAAVSNRVVVGKALTPPYKTTFDTAADFDIFTVVNANQDDSTWMYHGRHQTARIKNNPIGGDADDWLIMPPLSMQKDKTYTLTYVCYGNRLAPNTYGLSFGQGNDPLNYEVIFAKHDIPVTAEHGVYHERVTPKEDGIYHFAWHCNSAYGFVQMSVDSIFVDEGAVMEAPGLPTDFSVAADNQGKHEVKIHFVAPVTSVGGSPLTENITYHIMRDGVLLTVLENIKPGEDITYTDNKTSQGYYFYEIIPYNNYGVGLEERAMAYIGQDIPAEPVNVKLVDNYDGTVTLTWDAPSTTGANGGYVNPDELTYTVYYKSSKTVVESGLKETKLVIEDGRVNTADPTTLFYFVGAVSEAGEGNGGKSNVIAIGRPYKMTFMEGFPNGVAQKWWSVASDGGYNIFSPTRGLADDHDNGSVFWCAYNPGDHGWLNSGKISLEGAEHPVLLFSYYVMPGLDAKTKVFIDKATQGDDEVFSLDNYELEGERGWKRAAIPLDKYKDLKYIRLRLYGEAEDCSAVSAFDKISIRESYPVNLGVVAEMPKRGRINELMSIPVFVTNYGSELAKNYTVSLMANGEVVESKAGINLNPYEDASFVFNVIPNITDGSHVVYSAEVSIDNDADISDNTTKGIDVEIIQSGLPTVENFNVETNADNQVMLSWTQPQLVDREVTESFEYLDPWTITNYGGWTVHDVDGAETFELSGISFDHEGEAFGFIVANPEVAGIDTEVRPGFAPHTGKQYMMSVASSPYYCPEGHNDDWLVTPKLSGKAQTISFYGLSYSDQDGNDEFEMLYSTSGTKPDDFTLLDYVKVDNLDWTRYEAKVPDGTQYFAIRVISSNCVAFLIDDVCYKRAPLTIKNYNIWRDNILVGTAPADALSYIDDKAEDGSHKYAMTIVYTEGESCLSDQREIITTGIGHVEIAGAKILGMNGAILFAGIAGHEVSVYGANGMLADRFTPSSTMSKTYAPGVYIVSIGGWKQKVVVR